MRPREKKLLAMTALEETWGNSENILFLGEWCKRYERRNIWEQRNHEVIQFHWDDRVKLRRDYDYLVSLHHSFLAILTQALNEYHKVGHNLRYWQILLDPWLMSYLSVMFDRWECLRSAFETSENLSVILSENCDPLPPPYSYSEFVSLAASSDEWNQNIYHKIINSEYLGRFSISSLGLSFRRGTSGSTATTAIRQSILRKIASVSIGYIEKFVKSNDIVFIGSSFNWRALVKINLSLGQFPLLDPLLAFRTANNKSARDISCTGLPRRADLVINYSSESRFERFVINSIIDDIPRCLVEDYPILRDLTSYIPIRPKVIVTGSSHWADTFAKMWFAEQVRRGVKYVVLEHGGSLPPFMELFDFEADISDVRASWFMPYHSKHVRLPPPKIVGRYTNLYSIIRGLLTQKKYCTVIGNE